jgi:hypothetical protein
MKDIIYPFLALLIIIGLILVSVKLFTDNISGLNSELNTNSEQEKVLNVKLTSLRESRADNTVTPDSQAVVEALPPTNPLLGIMSNVRSQAQLFGLSLGGFSSGAIGGVASEGVSSGEITIDVEGGYQQILVLIENMKGSNPLIRFEGIKILSQGLLGVDNYKFTGDVFSYWAPLPTTLPAVSESFEGLTSEEEDVLAKVDALRSPTVNTLTSLPVATGSAGRADPFSL